MKFIRQKDAAGRMPERGKRKGSLRGIPGLALVLALGAVLAAGGMGTRTYAWGTLEAPGIEDNGEFVTFPSTSGKENGTETEKGNDWTSGLEGGTTIAILSDGEPSPNSDGSGGSENGEETGTQKAPNDMGRLLSGVTIENEKGENIKDGILYVGEKYKITLTFAEGGALSSKQFAWNDDGTMTFQLPENFKVDPKADVPLIVKVDGKDVTIGTYSVTEDGKLVVKLDGEGKQVLEKAFDAALNFEMDATVEAGDGTDGGHIKFNDAGEDFNFEVVDQARVEVDKKGKYVENEDKQGGNLEYTVTTTVKRGSISNLSILDEFTPPNTSALKVEEVNPDDIKVTLKQRGVDGTVTEVVLTKDTDYELVEVPDAEHPGKKTFQVKLKEDSIYSTLNEGDVLEVIYPYEVEYVKGTTDVFWGNVANDVHVTGKGKVPAPAGDPGQVTPEIDIDEHRGSNVEIIVTPPGDGIIFKTQEFSEADHKLHYTLYTKVPAGTWTPFYIHDDMAVEFGGERYNLLEFKENGRVSNLTVSAVDVENQFQDWDDNTDDLTKIGDLEKLKEQAHKLTGYNHFGYDFNFNAPEGYDSKSVENYICLWLNNNLEIVFGEWEYGKQGPWGNWNYPKDRLIITEYDLDMSDELGSLTLVDTSDYKTEIKKEASEVLLAGIRNVVQMRFDGYNPSYSVFFNNADRMNKTGVPDKSDNTITWTVTMNTTDTTVNQYFQEAKDDWMALNGDGSKYHWGNMPAAYNDSMQAVFYDELPEDGWEYVEGSLTATASDVWGNESSYPYDKDNQLGLQPVTQDGGKQVIRAPLMFFYDAGLEIHNLFDWFNSNLASLTFTYKLKATDQWIRAHATDTNPVTIHNYADIRDNLHPQPHWNDDVNVDYLPQHLSKTAVQVGDSNLLQFTLSVNPGSVKLDSEKGYLVVTDTSTNLEIQKGSIKVTDTAGNELTQVNYAEGMTLEDNGWALMPETEIGQFKLMVPDGKALLVTYNALIPTLGTGIPVSNKAGIEGVVNADTGFDRTINVNSINAGGSASTSTLNFEKVDSIDKTKKLSGAKFKFYIVLDDTGDESGDGNEDKLEKTDTITVGGKKYSCHSESDWEFTTNDDGVYEIQSGWRLAPGNYYILEEITPPAGYEGLKEPVLFYFGAANQVNTETHPGATTALPGGTLTVDDPPIQYSLPETGGSGTVFYVVTGLALILGGGIVLTAQKRRRQAQ